MRFWRLTVALFLAAEFNLTIYINEIKGTTWFDEFSFCKSIGMDLYSPDDTETNQQVMEILENAGIYNAFTVGATRFGSKCFWYSTRTGVEIDFKYSPKDFSRDSWTNYCLEMRPNKLNGFHFQDVDCYSPSEAFICEYKEPYKV